MADGTSSSPLAQSSESDDVQVVDPAAPAENLPAVIDSVWEQLVQLVEEPVTNGIAKQKIVWKCLAPGCGKQWNGANSSKALASLLSAGSYQGMQRDGISSPD